MHRSMESENMPTLQFAIHVQNASMVLTERHLPRTKSTNDVAIAWLKTAAPGTALSVWTSNQTQGRGQRGNEWDQQEGMDIAWSLAIKWADSAIEADPIALNKAVTARLCAAVEHLISGHGVECGIKWPNDILLRRAGEPWQKCAGLLIESSWKASRWDGVCIGLGVNVNSDREGAPRQCSLRDYTQSTFPLSSIASTLCEAALEALEETDYEAEYNRRLIGLGNALRFRHLEHPGIGIIEGVNAKGSLVLKWQPDGSSTKRLEVAHSNELKWDGLWLSKRD